MKVYRFSIFISSPIIAPPLIPRVWIYTGRVDCVFFKLPTNKEFETIFLHKDKLMAIIPENHSLKDADKFPVSALCNEPLDKTYFV